MNERSGTGIREHGARRRVTMTDIAREVGCSQSTVSFVLNHNPSVRISETMHRKVHAAADRLGYHRARAGTRAERQLPVRKVGFLIDSLSTSPEGIVAIQGVRRALEPGGSLLMIAETGNDPLHEPLTIQSMIRDGVDALIYACIFTRTIAVPTALRDARVPAVLLNCAAEDLSLPSVVPGEIAGGERATRMLLEAGHERIGTILGEGFMDATRDRFRGYRRALASAGLPVDPELVIEGDWSPSAGYRGTDRLMSLDRPPSAIFCQNDRMAIGCYERLKEMGLRIPQEVSVVGYDDEEIARHLSPPLTTLVLPHREMGRWAIETLDAGATRSGGRIRTEVLECIPVERQSVGPGKSKRLRPAPASGQLADNLPGSSLRSP